MALAVVFNIITNIFYFQIILKVCHVWDEQLHGHQSQLVHGMLCLEVKLSHKLEVCKSSFKDIALALKFDYILNEYSSLSDAWRVYQGVGLYRDYRRIGGETKQFDVEPRYEHYY